MYYRDLATNCDIASGPEIRAIGWLSKHISTLQGPFPMASLLDWSNISRPRFNPSEALDFIVANYAIQNLLWIPGAF